MKANGFPKKVLFGGRYLPIWYIWYDGERKPKIRKFSAQRKKNDPKLWLFWTLASWTDSDRKVAQTTRLFRVPVGRSPRARLLRLGDDLASMKVDDAQKFARDLALSAVLMPSTDEEVAQWLREHPQDVVQ